jgi:hypothetical protein
VHGIDRIGPRDLRSPLAPPAVKRIDDDRERTKDERGKKRPKGERKFPIPPPDEEPDRNGRSGRGHIDVEV